MPDGQPVGTAQTDDADKLPEEVLAEWRVHLLRKHPGRSILLVTVCILAVAFLHLVFGQRLGFTVLAALILLGSFLDWLLPIKYRLTTRGASYNNIFLKKRIAWEEIRSCYVSGFGLKLSPFSRRTRLDAFRGFVLRFAGNRDEVIRIVKQRATNRRP